MISPLPSLVREQTCAQACPSSRWWDIWMMSSVSTFHLRALSLQQAATTARNQPQTPNPKSRVPNPKPQTPNPKSQTPNPKPQTPNPKSRIPNPNPQGGGREGWDPKPQPSCPSPWNPKPQTLNPEWLLCVRAIRSCRIWDLRKLGVNGSGAAARAAGAGNNHLFCLQVGVGCSVQDVKCRV